MTYPTPTGQAPAATQLTTQTWDQQVGAIVAEMRAKGWDQLATSFQSFAATFHAQNPSADASTALQAYLVTAVGKDVAAGVGGTATVEAGIPGAAAAGAENAIKNLTDPFSWIAKITGISGHNLLVRGLKIIVGGVLLLAGIIKLTGAGKAIPVIAGAATRLPGV
jgi:hypothetical protein